MTHIHAPVPSVRFFQRYVSELIKAKWSVQTAGAPPATATIPPLDSGAANTEEVVLAGNAPDANAAASPETQLPATGRPAAIWNRLAVLLEQQLLDASRIAGPVGVEFHREAVYVMAVLTDEMFVHLEWEGREYWLAHLFEARFFRSHFGGQRLFARIDELLTRDDEPAAETATVYLMALALGFRGRYFAPSHEAILDSYRNRLFFFIARREPELAESAKRLFPETYRFTIQAGAPRRLADPRRWVIALGGAVIVWLIVAQLVWRDLTTTTNLSRKVDCLKEPDFRTCEAEGNH
jgi:type VI secretion system protein ImpK